MPDPKFTKPWHGIPREEIDWHPTINEDACIGCGTCVTGCSRLVYRFDYTKNKAVVAGPTKTVRAVLDVLKDTKVSESNIFNDAFGG